MVATYTDSKTDSKILIQKGKIHAEYNSSHNSSKPSHFENGWSTNL